MTFWTGSFIKFELHHGAMVTIEVILAVGREVIVKISLSGMSSPEQD